VLVNVSHGFVRVNPGAQLSHRVAVQFHLVRVVVGGLVLVPQKSQGHPLSLHLLLRQRPVRLSPDSIGADNGRVKEPLQRSIIQILGQGPGQASSVAAVERAAKRGSVDGYYHVIFRRPGRLCETQ